MKMEIWNEEKVKEEVLRLRLFDEGANIVLRAVDEKGERIVGGAILSIKPDGEIYIIPAFNVPGIQPDEQGRAIVHGYKPCD